MLMRGRQGRFSHVLRVHVVSSCWGVNGGGGVPLLLVVVVVMPPLRLLLLVVVAGAGSTLQMESISILGLIRNGVRRARLRFHRSSPLNCGVVGVGWWVGWWVWGGGWGGGWGVECEGRVGVHGLPLLRLLLCCLLLPLQLSPGIHSLRRSGPQTCTAHRRYH